MVAYVTEPGRVAFVDTRNPQSRPYLLEGTAVAIWTSLGDQSRTAPEVAADLAEDYGVDPDTIIADVERFLWDLHDKGVVLTNEATADTETLAKTLAQTRTLAGIPIRITTPDDAAHWLCRTATGARAAIDIHLANAYTLALADHDDTLHRVLRTATVTLPDSKPLTWMSRLTGKPLHQVRGPRLFTDVLDLGRGYCLRHFLLGTTPQTLTALQTRLEQQYPGLQIVGSYSPPFRALSEQEAAEQDARVLASGADIVWVSLGTPKQDFETQRLARWVHGMAVAIGAAFDFAAGTKREAPEWMSRIGVEWLFRLASEPRRLWRRYLIGNIQFLIAVWRKR